MHRVMLFSLFTLGAFVMKTTFCSRNRNRSQTLANREFHIYFLVHGHRINSSTCIFTLDTTAFLKLSDFHSIIPDFVNQMTTALENRNDNNEVLFVLQTLFHNLRKKKTVSTLEDLANVVNGYYTFYISKDIMTHTLQKIPFDGEIYSVIGGCYVSEYAYSILIENAIDFLVMDTTFTLFPHYVTAFLYGVFRNTGIPLALAFGRTENLQLYKYFYENFDSKLNFDLKRYKLLSDKGTGLAALCNIMAI
jgi:hypothetical protein